MQVKCEAHVHGPFFLPYISGITGLKFWVNMQGGRA
jgi:hypothetical protein